MLRIIYLFIIFCVWTEKINSSTNGGGKVILDMSQVFTDAINGGHLASDTIGKIVASGSKTTKSTISVMYIELDLQSMPGSNLKNFVDFLTAVNKDTQTKLLVSFRDPKWSVLNNDMNLYLQRYFFNVIPVLIKQSSLFTGISIDLGNVGYYCEQQSQNLVQELKRVISNEKPNIKIGYVLDFEHINCSVHTKNIEHSDYIIVKMPLKLNDGVFIESYEMFKENMQSIVYLVAQNTILTRKSLYYGVSLNGTLNRGELRAYKLVKNSLVYPDGNDQNIMAYAQGQLNQANGGIASRYEELLTKYIHEWVTTDGKNDLKIILTYLHGYPGTIFDEHGWMESKLGTIPYMTNFDFLEKDSQHPSAKALSANILLEDLASAGFRTVMFNEKTWMELVTRFKDLKNCHKRQGKCRPYNAICMLDGKLLLSILSNKKDLHNFRSIRGMKLKTIYFSSDKNGEAISHQWSDFLHTFRGNSNSIESACRSWSGVLTDFPANCDNACIGNTVRHVSGCGSIKNITNNGFVWRIQINFQNESNNEFNDKVLKRLGGFVIARQLLRIEYPNKKVTLQIMGAFHGTSNNKFSEYNGVYCNRLGWRVNQFYEAILTWARIHDFPVILEQADYTKGIGNPLLWTKLTTKENSDPLHELMETAPIFVRRSYNESLMLGPWMQGMYSCIHKASEKSIVNLKFEHEFSGVSLNLSLPQEEENLKVDQVQTMLHLVLEKFQKVEIILETSEEMKTLEKAVLDPSFEQVLKVNEISTGKKIYVQVQNENSRVTISALEKLGFKVYITSSFHLGHHNHINKLIATFNNHDIGIVHPNCSLLAYDIIAGKPASKSLDKVDYLICETLPISVDNLNEEKMQNYLDSHLYLTKLVQYTFPKLKEIHFRLHSTFPGNGSPEQNENIMLMFLSDLNNYAKAYKVNYFLLPAFTVGERNSPGKETSVWKITDYDNLPNTHSVFHDDEAVATIQLKSIEPDIPNQMPETSSWTQDEPTEMPSMPSMEVVPVPEDIITSDSVPQLSAKTPKITEKLPKGTNLTANVSSSSDTVDGSNSGGNRNGNKEKDGLFSSEFTNAVIALTVLTVIVTFFGCLKHRITHSYLSAKEMNDFMNGRQETLEEAAFHRRRKKRFTGSIFDGLMFQKEYNLSKGDVVLNSKVILGESKFCTVHRGRMHDGQSEVVVKVAKKTCSKEIFKGMLSEVKLLCYLGDHSNIVRFMGCYKKEMRRGSLWIVMEFCSGGTLHSYLMGKRENIGNEQGIVLELIKFSQEIACGMEYIAKQNIVHGDLCAINVLLNSRNNCKIKCFGLSRKLQEYQGFMKKNQHEKILPWRWMAPESLRKLEFSTQSDVWSYGVTLWEIFSLGDTPHSEVSRTINLTGDLEKGMQLRNPDYATKEIYNVMLECCKVEPESRPDFSCMVRFFTDLLVENTANNFQSVEAKSEEILNF